MTTKKTLAMWILVLDDVYELGKLLQTMLEYLGFKVLLGRNGLEGLDLLGHASTLPVLIISNYLMPRMDGLTFLRQVRQNPLWKNIPFVLCTAHITNPSPETAREYGVEAVLAKPFQFSDVKSLLSRLGLRP